MNIWASWESRVSVRDLLGRSQRLLFVLFSGLSKWVDIRPAGNSTPELEQMPKHLGGLDECSVMRATSQGLCSRLQQP